MAGVLLLLLSLAGIALGSFMALNGRTRGRGMFFAIWWITAAAASAGILMRDRVTFTVGAFCFIVAGAALALEQRGSRRPDRGSPGSRGSERQNLYERTKRWLSNKIRECRKLGP